MSLVKLLTCDCNPGKVYSSRSTFRSHLKSQRHLRWENVSDVTKLRVEYESEIRGLKRHIAELETQIKNMCSQPRARRVSESVKKKVAYAQNWKCNRCNAMLPSCYEVDHIIPLWKNGTNQVSNLRALCRNCHGSKTQDDLISVE